MPYEIIRHSAELVWVTMHGRLTMEHAERYFNQMWQTLDSCPRPTDLLVDGRQMESAPNAARQRTEQVIHHPHLGHIAFVVSQHHLLLFAPLMRLVSGIGLYGNEQEAVDYLRRSRALPSLGNTRLPAMTPRPEAAAREVGDPATRALHSLTDMVNGWSRGLRSSADERESPDRR